ncbi:hypothetical protein Glove_415g35 [Diversispora epigaea]|uniref:Uncharacterized protein n=1 Tax=Diversispora epigaea TaxID=1348612 RepID=A0A397GX79_9GLOM|nr:hypothetical protein Glove_415g35 [Diversispora epigaea]
MYSKRYIVVVVEHLSRTTGCKTTPKENVKLTILVIKFLNNDIKQKKHAHDATYSVTHFINTRSRLFSYQAVSSLGMVVMSCINY